MPLKHMRELDEELLACRDVLKGCDGQLQAMLIWYSSKGTELEDKDFAVLNFDQWQELWIDANIPSGTLDSAEIVKSMWQKMVVVNQMLGAYQLAAPGFYAALIHLAAALYGGCGSSPDLSSLSEMLMHLIVDLLTPNFGVLLAPKLKELQTAEIPESIAVFLEFTDTTEKAISIHKIPEVFPEPTPVYPEGYVLAGQQLLVPPPEQTPQPPNPKDTIAAKGSKDAKGKDGGGGKKVEAGKMTDAKGKDASAGAKNADSAGKKGSEAKEKVAGGAKDGATKKEDVKSEPKLETKKGGKKKGDKKGEEEPVKTEDRGVQADVPEEVRNLLPYFKKWKILGPHWDPGEGAACMIYALQTSTVIQEFKPVETDRLTFGLIELKRVRGLKFCC
ncbi:unnamed protein product [Sphagnum jensenii]|uniref:Uncharacterized protein n=1 Tax=Sphagnum jensenii TaxID=128206 RepID=A0ABP0X811_9BRYO